jgi:hypothetical protein
LRDIVTQVWLSKHLTLAAVSPTICRAQPDWPAAVRVCGFLDTPNLAMEGDVPAGLAAFLAAGDAPVYMTFGSWMPRDPAGQTSMASTRRSNSSCGLSLAATRTRCPLLPPIKALQGSVIVTLADRGGSLMRSL